jgi:hypothetical protein
MTRRARILTVEQADAAVERLAWLRSVGHPNGAVKELFDAYATVRAAVHRQEAGEVKKPGFAERVTAKRN